ncbi:hypothetical protein [Helicobacter sp. 23-1045]
MRKKTSESNGQNNEIIADSAIRTKNAESSTKSQNLTRDFSLTLFAQNDKTMDCHDLTSSNLAMT